MSIIAAFAVPHPPIILPEIGRGEEQTISATTRAYRAAMGRAARFRPETIVLTSPHSVMYEDYFHISPGRRADGTFSQFGAPQVRLETEYDVEFVTALEKRCGGCGVPAGTLGERNPALDHGTMIPLRFLNEFFSDYRLVRIGLSGLSPLEHYRLGQCIAQTAEALGRRTIFLASGDLSHKLTRDGPYGFAPEGPEFDRLATAALGKGDFAALLEMDPDVCEAAAECGLRSFWIMAGALDQKAVASELLSYEGPFGVGYGVAAFEVTGPDESRNFGGQFQQAERDRLAAGKAAEDPLVRLARMSLETYVKTGRYADPPQGLPDTLTGSRAGAFVSLKKDGRLRGCIGTIAPTRACLAEEILHNAVSAGTGDPRFPPVRKEELETLVYSVDVLGEPEPIASEAELDPKKYGVIVEQGTRRGLLLPDLAGVDTPDLQIAIARRKAGIGPDEPVKLWRFEVVRHR
ncbi:MAG: AmmeMemoRadiSam system protein A [Intestinimonas sp.]|nr:AmmeMemoRadiSam system protein A [Intestinimonas sp.]